MLDEVGLQHGAKFHVVVDQQHFFRWPLIHRISINPEGAWAGRSRRPCGPI
jgi:hypothetical protein